MQKKISIGLLLPMSTILPMGKQFEMGLKEGIKPLQTEDGWDVTIQSEFTGQGSYRKNEEAINKLISFHEVDIISGIVGNKTVAQLANKFQEHKKPFVANNLGEHLPNIGLLNEFIFINSPHVWQHIWSLSNWAVQQFGKTGMFVGGTYDAGYNFMKMMGDGMNAVTTDNAMPYSVAPLDDTKKYSQVEKVFEHIALFKPDFVFSFFCGTEASAFLREYINQGYHKKIPLFGLPFLMESFEPNGEEITIYSAISSKVSLDMGLQQQERRSPFEQMGLETGMMLAEAIKTAGSDSIEQVLKRLKLETPMGTLQADLNNLGKGHHVYLTSTKYKGDKSVMERHLLQELPTLQTDSEQFIESTNQMSSYWENPYLAV